jgi:hypothetical protein
VSNYWTEIIRAEPRVSLVAKLNAHVAADRQRGGLYAGRATVDQRIIEEHKPAGPETPTTCTACADEQWPCGMIASVLAPD